MAVDPIAAQMAAEEREGLLEPLVPQDTGFKAVAPPDPIAAQMVEEERRVNAQQAQLMRWRAANEEVDPGTRAEVLRYSAASGLSPEFVETSLPDVKRMVDAEGVDWAQVVLRQPALTRLMLEKPELQPLVKDDVANLRGLEWALKAPFHALADGLLEQAITLPLQFLDAHGMSDEKRRAKIETAVEMFGDKDYGAENLLESGLVGGARALPSLAGDILARIAGALGGAAIVGTKAGAVGAAATAPAGGTGAVPAAVGGAVAGAAVGQFAASGLFNYYQSVGPLYWRLSNLKDANGQPLEEGIARSMAMAGSVVNGALFAGFMGKVGANIPGIRKLYERAGVVAVEKALAEQSVAHIAKATARRWGEPMLYGVATMAAQSAINQVAEESAKGLSSGDLEADWSNVAIAAKDGLVHGFEDMWLLMAVAPGRQLIRDVGQARKSAESAARLQAIATAASGSKLLQRYPDGFREAVLIAKQEKGAVQNAIIPAEAWVRYWQEQKVDPGEVASRILGDGGKALADALATKSDLVIPIEKYVTALGKTAHIDGLSLDTKLYQDELTPRQFTEKQKATEAELREKAKVRKSELTRDGERVREFIREQALAAGISKTEADGVARQVEEYAKTMAVRLNVTVAEAANLGGLGKLRIFGPKGETVALAARRQFQEWLSAPEAAHSIKKRIDSMKEDPVARARTHFIDENTGLRNARAFRAMAAPEGKPLVGHISVEGIRYVNLVAEHKKADLLYRAVAKALHAIDPNAAFVDGDFALHVESPERLGEIVNQLREAVAVKGFEITGSVGKDLAEAAKEHKKAKLAAEVAGARANPRVPHPTIPKKTVPQKPFGLEKLGIDVKDIDFPKEAARAELDADLVQKARDMSDEAFFRETFTEAGTGLLNIDGWNAIPRKPFVASIDLKDVGRTDQEHGARAADKLTRWFGKLATHYGGSSFDFARLHGDEYAAQFNTKPELEAFLASFRQKLQNVSVRVTSKTGDVVALPIDFRFDTGESYEAADRKLSEAKDREALAAGADEGGDRRPAAGGPGLLDGGALDRGHDGREGQRGPLGRGARGQVYPGHREARGEGTPGEGGPGGAPGHDVRGLTVTYIEGVPLVAPSGVEQAREMISRMRSPENRETAQAFLEYAIGQRDTRPKISPELEKKLATFGVVDPVHGFTWDEDGRSLERELGGPKKSVWSDKGMQERAKAQARELRRNTTAAGYYEQAAFHGTPHRGIEKFSLQKIGTGEGAQAFGWGLYFAGNKEVAEHYRRSLAPMAVEGWDSAALSDAQNLVLTAISGFGSVAGGFVPGGKEKLRQHFRAAVASRERRLGLKAGEPIPKASDSFEQRLHDELTTYREAAELASAIEDSDVTRATGQTYRVDVPENDRLLDHDLPLSKQPERVRQAIEAALPKLEQLARSKGMPEKDIAYLLKFFEPKDGIRGESIYEAIGDLASGKLGASDDAPRLASEFLRDIGVPGLRYLDEGSRAQKDGTHNYVIWDENEVRILDTLYQGGSKGPRGLIRLTLEESGHPREFDISILRGDRSTLAHETAHFLSWSLHDIATSDLATPALRKDYADLLTWTEYESAEARLAETKERSELGARAERNELDDAGRERLRQLSAKEERFSHAWEQYLAEGKAPSKELAGVFGRFKKWLLNIYRGMDGIQQQFRELYGEDINLSPEVRAIFDRMLAVDDALKEVQEETRIGVPFQELLQHMEEPERQKYLEALARARTGADQQANARAAELMNPEEMAEQRRELEMDAAIELDQQPVYRVMRYLQRGELVDGDGLPFEQVPEVLLDKEGKPFKVSRGDFVEKYGADAVRQMPPGIFARTKKGGAPIAQLAALLGFESGDALVDAFRKAEPRDAAIARIAQERMDERYGPVLQRIAEETMSAAHNDAAIQATWMELAAMARLVNPRASRQLTAGLEPELLAKAAERAVGDTVVGDLNPARHARAERSALKQQQLLWGKGQREEAVEHGRARLLSMAMYRAERDIQKRLERAEEKLSSANDKLRGRLGKADRSYRDVYDTLLEAVGLGRARPGAEERLGLDALLERAKQDAQEMDFDVEGIRKLLAEPKRWETLTAAEALNVADAAANIRRAAKNRLEVDLAGKRQQKDDFFAELEEHVRRRPAEPPRPYSRTAEGLMDKVRHLARGADAMLTEVAETYAELLDGGNRHGPAHRLLIDSRLEARKKEAELTRQVSKAILAKWENVPKDIRKLRDQVVDVAHLLPVPPADARGSIRPVYTRDTLWMLYLNLGNEGNRQRLRDGNGWSDENMLKAVGLLSEPELDFLQGILDVTDSLYPEIAAAYRARTGLDLEKVTATPVVVNGVERRGGYWPLRYDSRFSRPGEMQEGEAIAAMFQPNYVKPAAPSGHTKKRVEKVNAPVDLSWGVGPAHLQQVIHDIAYGNWVRQAGGIFLDQRWKDIANHYLGPERAKEFIPWLRDVANARADSAAAAHADFSRELAGFARNRVAVAALAHNLPVLMQSMVDPLNAAVLEGISPRYLAMGYLKASNPFAWKRLPELQLSEEIRYRETALKDNLRATLEKAGPTGKGVGRIIAETNFALYDLVDRFLTRIVFKAAFDQAKGKGESDAEAARIADDILRRRFVSYDVAEAAPILRRRHGIGAVLMFYSYANRNYNALRRTFGGEKSKAEIAAMLMGFGLVGALGSYLAGRGPMKEDDELEWLAVKALLEPFNTVPFLGSALEGAIKGQKINMRVAPELALIEDNINRIGELVEKSKKGTVRDEEKIWAGIEAMIAIAGGPIGQVQRTGGYVQQVTSGQERPRNPADVASGLIYGKRQRQPRNPISDVADMLEE